MTKRVSGEPAKKTKKKKQKPEKLDDNQIVIVNNIQAPPAQESELRTINLYGDITEQKGADVVAALLYLENTSHSPFIEDPNDPDAMPVIVAVYSYDGVNSRWSCI